MTNWLAVSIGKDGVTKQTCNAPQKDMSMLTVFLSYKPMMAYTPLENWEQTARKKREKKEHKKQIKLNRLKIMEYWYYT